MTQYVYHTPIAAVRAAAKYEAQGLVVVMSTASTEELWGIEHGGDVITLDVYELEDSRHVA